MNFPFKHGQTFSGHSTFVRLLGVFLLGLRASSYSNTGVFFVAAIATSPQVRRDARRVFFPDSCRTTSPNGCKHVRPEISEGSVDLMRQRFLEFLLLPKVLNPCDSPKKAGPSEIKNWHHFLGFPCEKPSFWCTKF